MVVHKDKTGYQFRRQPIGQIGEQAARTGGENRTTISKCLGTSREPRLNISAMGFARVMIVVPKMI